MAAALHPGAVVRLTPRAEQAFRLEVERVGGYAIDRDEATQASDAFNFLDDCEVLLKAVRA